MADFTPRPTDVCVAVMGMTGAGKSTLISLCTGQDVPIGHQLQACTQVVDIYKMAWSNTTDVYLIDTPGFDDTNRSDTEVLKEIATWFTRSYEDNIKLSGILYLHRINDTRMVGSAKKNLFMLRKLCGSSALSGIALVSTMWEVLTDVAEGARREKELVDTQDFWGVLVGSGARVKRHDNTLESAHALIKSFIRAEGVGPATTMVMDIQREMVTEHKTLDQTQAGREVQVELEQARERFRQELAEVQETMQEAMRARDHEAAEMLRQHQEETRRKLEDISVEKEQLRVTMEKMHEEVYARLEQRYQEQAALLARQREESDKELGRIRARGEETSQQLAEFKQNNDRIQQELDRRLKEDGSSKQKLESPGAAAASAQRSGIKALLSMLRPPPIMQAPGLRKLGDHIKLALSGQHYIFIGPLHSYWHVPLSWSQTLVRSAGKSLIRHIAALGTDGSWFFHYHLEGICHTRRSDNLKAQYPQLNDFLDEPAHSDSCPRYISLGNNGSFFIHLVSGARASHLHQGLLTAVGGLAKIERVWHGYSNTYVVERTDGHLVWSLDGHYAGLSSWMKGIERIADLALNVDNPQSFVAISRKGEMAYNDSSGTNSFRMERWQGFVARNYGL